MTPTPRFLEALTREMTADLDNSFGEDNWDPERFGPYHAASPPSLEVDLPEALSRIEHLLDGLESTYVLLADEHSKSMLVKVWAYRLLGYQRVRLPLSTPEYRAKREALKSLVRGTDEIDGDFLGRLRRMDFASLGLPIEMYFGALGAMNTFVVKQYQYGRPEPIVTSGPGDSIIDGGGCYGDTALYFANEIGPHGKVYSFEFMPHHIEIHRRNLALNPALGDRVELVPRALWETSGEVIHYVAGGPGTSLITHRRPAADAGALQVTTVAIDDFVRQRALPRVDFIKMDIEGAELGALRGAENVIRVYRPSLAISVYHQPSDFVEIPSYVHGLGLGYRFYLDHFTMYGEETVLFATAR